MKTSLTHLAAAGLALALVSTSALAASGPLPGVTVTVQNSAGGVVVTTRTDAAGAFSFDLPAKGNYRVRLGGDSLGPALARTDPTPTAQPRIIGVLVALLLPAPQKQAATAFKAELPLHPTGHARGAGMRFAEYEEVSFSYRAVWDETCGGGGCAGPLDSKPHRYRGSVTLLK